MAKKRKKTSKVTNQKETAAQSSKAAGAKYVLVDFENVQPKNLELLKEHPRALNVLERADDESQWRHSLRSGRAWGIAFAEAFGSLVCQVVEISGSTSSLRVRRVTCVVDCGTAINPGSVEMQMQSGIIHGLNAALWGGQRFREGRPKVANFNAIRMLRVKDAPDVDVHIIDSGEPPGGIGEPGVPPIAPAVANAYYRLVGVRVRELPFFTG